MDKPRRSLKGSGTALDPPGPAINDLIESAADAVLSMTVDHEITWGNPAAARLWGYRKSQDLIGKRYLDLVVPEHRPRATRDLDRLRSLKTYRSFYRMLKKDGSVIPVEISEAVVESGEGTGPSGVVLIARDAQAREAMDQEILGTTEKELRRVAMDLHDGACSNLCGIACMAESMAQELGKRGSDDASEIGEIGRLLRAAIAEIRGTIHGISPVVGHEKGLCPALVRLAGSAEQRYGVRCEFRSSGQVAVGVEKATHIFRIAQEAIRNAVTHGRARSVEMDLRPDGNAWILSVRDDGVGLPQPCGPEMGMGLAIMNYRGRLIDAAVAVKSRPEGGVEVTCRFLA